jgi:hypothetical protein
MKNWRREARPNFALTTASAEIAGYDFYTNFSVSRIHAKCSVGPVEQPAYPDGHTTDCVASDPSEKPIRSTDIHADARADRRTRILNELDIDLERLETQCLNLLLSSRDIPGDRCSRQVVYDFPSFSGCR